MPSDETSTVRSSTRRSSSPTTVTVSFPALRSDHLIAHNIIVHSRTAARPWPSALASVIVPCQPCPAKRPTRPRLSSWPLRPFRRPRPSLLSSHLGRLGILSHLHVLVAPPRLHGLGVGLSLASQLPSRPPWPHRVPSQRWPELLGIHLRSVSRSPLSSRLASAAACRRA